MTKEYITKRVHELYWEEDINCARTALICQSEIFGIPNEIVSACYGFASGFEHTFGSLRCLELRPTGFSENDPPHMCEGLTCKAIWSSYRYISEI